MSVHSTHTGRWEVRWREGTRQLSRTFIAKSDADGFDLQRRRQSQLGVHGTSDASAVRLEDWLQQWWGLEATGWRRSTRLPRASHLDKWIVPRLGQVKLRERGALRVAARRSAKAQAR